MPNELTALRKRVEQFLNSLVKFLRHSKKTLLLILVVAAITVALTTGISILLTSVDNLTFPSLGTIRTTRLKASIEYIDWGTIYPGTLTTHSLYVQSESNIKTTLILETENWTFRDSEGRNVTESLATYIKRPLAMNLTWDYAGTPVNPGEKIYVTLTLQAYDNIQFINYIINENVQRFSFDIHIYAKE